MKILSAALATAGAFALALAGAAPAMAAGRDIDPGDSMYTISCDDIYNDWQLLSVEASTAVSTGIGDGTGNDDLGGCANQPAYDASTGKSYYVQITFDGENVHWALASVNVTTGASTTVAEFLWENGEFPTLVRIDAIAIAPDGTAYAIGDGTLWSLDLANATVEPIGETLNAYAFASDPRTGEFYAIEYGGDVYSFDDIANSGAATFVGSITHPDLDLDGDVTGVRALQIDGGGTFWIVVDTREGFSDLWSFTPATLTSPVLSGLLTDDPFFSQALLIIPGAALAATGADLSIVPYLAGGAALAVIAGGAALLIRRRRA
ncbi:MAG: hypothetical protein IT189_00580 [Microbacteriaceae bacterium]|nr:hypothetical protein [Microbacteriaceae bacterium]